MSGSLPAYDVTARKVHQAVCVILLACAFVIGAGAAAWVVDSSNRVRTVNAGFRTAEVLREQLLSVAD